MDIPNFPKENWFSDEEYQRRLSAVRREMSKRDLGGLVLFSPANIFYLTGHHSIDSWEFRAVLITPDRDPLLLLYSFERGRFLASSWLNEARFHLPGADPVLTLIQLIADVGPSSGGVGIELNTPFLNETSTQLWTGNLPAVHRVAADGLIERIRLCKSPEELKCIRRAADFTKVGMQAAVRTIREGVMDHEIAAAAAHAMLMAGSDLFVMMPTVAVGYRSGLSHSEHGHIEVNRGDPVFIELSGCWRHYCAPLMLTTTLGTPSAEWKELLDVSHHTADVILNVARPGVPASEVARAAWEAIRRIEDRIQFHYNFGYSLGISFPPHWLEDSHFHIKTSNPEILEAGMVFHSPLTMRLLGRCAAGTSRTFEITDQGSQVLTGDDERDAFL